MADEKSGGWLSKIGQAIASEISDAPQAPKPVKAKAPVSVAPPEYVPPSTYIPPAVNSGITPAYTPLPAGASPFAAAMAAAPPVDEETLGLINNSVFPAGTASLYVTFNTMWNALGRTPDVNMVMNALKAAMPDVTAEKIIAAIKAHAKSLAATAKAADGDLEKAAEELLGGADRKIASLLEANAAAQADIEARQKLMAENIATIGATQQERVGNEQKIVNAKGRTDAAVAHVGGELTRAEAFISPLVAPKTKP
jgi:hypothetical protein